MTKIAFCNTKEGIHLTAKRTSIKAWALGCSPCVSGPHDNVTDAVADVIKLRGIVAHEII